VPSLKDIKRRIVSVEKTQQITRAMRMVAAAKLRRATEAIESARPYAERMRQTLIEVASAAGPEVELPLLATRPERRVAALVVITSDRGLAGAFNANVLKSAERLATVLSREVERLEIVAVGRKATQYFRRHRRDQLAESHEIGANVRYDMAALLADTLAGRYATGGLDQVTLIYNEFVSTLTQRPREVQLLPFEAPAGDDAGEGGHEALPYSFEPSAEELLKTLVPKAIEVEVFRALLENQAGEHAARMTAMENATRNTEELIEKLTLEYNRARQAAITKELVEIVTGAQALD